MELIQHLMTECVQCSKHPATPRLHLISHFPRSQIYRKYRDEDNYSEMLERIMDVLNSVINADLAKSSVLTNEFVHKHLAQTTDESEKEFWLKLMSHVMQLNQISVINSKEKEM